MTLVCRKLKEIEKHQCHFLQALKKLEHGFKVLQTILKKAKRKK